MAHAFWRKEFRWETLKAWIFPPVLVGLAGLILCGLNPHGYNAILTPLNLLARGTGGSGGSSILMSISELTPGEGHRLLYLLSSGRGVCLRLPDPRDLRPEDIPAGPVPVCHRLQGSVGLCAGRVDDGSLPLPRGIASHDRVPVGGGGMVPHQSDPHAEGAGGRAETKGEEGASACAGLRPVRSPSAPHRGPCGHRRRRRPRPRRFRRNDAGVLFFPVGVRGGNHGAQVLLRGVGVSAEESHPGKDVQLLRHRRFPRLAALSWRPNLLDGRTYNREVFMEHQTVTGARRGGRRSWRNTASTISS